mmetsp:Transcript_50981/g.147981  ORF Transcript_50981/g.147981 Transcript_50981/m.147981 type:complete len:210 (-) Transcript_50981:7-636(-)
MSQAVSSSFEGARIVLRLSLCTGSASMALFGVTVGAMTGACVVLSTTQPRPYFAQHQRLFAGHQARRQAAKPATQSKASRGRSLGADLEGAPVGGGLVGRDLLAAVAGAGSTQATWRCAQHHLFLGSGQSRCQWAYPTLQLNGAGVVCSGHRPPGCGQHQAFLAGVQTSCQLAGTGSQLKLGRLVVVTLCSAAATAAAGAGGAAATASR